MATTPTIVANGEGPNPTIEPYTSGLTGIDQESNEFFHDLLFWFLGAFALSILALRLWELSQSWLRHKITLDKSAKEQRYYATNHGSYWPWIKREVIYAPIGSKLHNQEIKLSRAVSVGTLPTRAQAVILTVYFLANLVFCAWLNYSVENKWAVVAQLRGRSGYLAVTNLLPTVLFAMRNNPLIPLLKISFDSFNLMHRWLGRITVLETIVHTLAWAITQNASDGWSSVTRKTFEDPFIGLGTVGTVVAVLIVAHSVSPLRHAFYETFLNSHILLGAIFMITVLVHVDLGNLPQRPHCIVILAMWLFERGARVVHVAWRNRSSWFGSTYASISKLPAEACLVTIHLPKYVDIKPGSHAYLRFYAVSWWESHPFSVAWVVHTPIRSDDATLLPITEKIRSEDLKKNHKTSVSFVIQAHSGFTRKLYDATVKHLGSIRTPVLVEGPYGGHHSLDSYGHVVLFAGSSGITYQISHLTHLLRECPKGTIATRKITLVWVVRSLDQVNWVKTFMDEILNYPSRKQILTIKLHVTRPKSTAEVMSPSSTIQMYPGRPPIARYLEQEVSAQAGAMCVSVCGSGSLADSVRHEVRKLGDESNIDFLEEAFTW